MARAVNDIALEEMWPLYFASRHHSRAKAAKVGGNLAWASLLGTTHGLLEQQAEFLVNVRMGTCAIALHGTWTIRDGCMDRVAYKSCSLDVRTSELLRPFREATIAALRLDIDRRWPACLLPEEVVAFRGWFKKFPDGLRFLHKGRTFLAQWEEVGGEERVNVQTRIDRDDAHVLTIEFGQGEGGVIDIAYWTTQKITLDGAGSSEVNGVYLLKEALDRPEGVSAEDMPSVERGYPVYQKEGGEPHRADGHLCLLREGGAWWSRGVGGSQTLYYTSGPTEVKSPAKIRTWRVAKRRFGEPTGQAPPPRATAHPEVALVDALFDAVASLDDASKVHPPSGGEFFVTTMVDIDTRWMRRALYNSVSAVMQAMQTSCPADVLLWSDGHHGLYFRLLPLEAAEKRFGVDQIDEGGILREYVTTVAEVLQSPGCRSVHRDPDTNEFVLAETRPDFAADLFKGLGHVVRMCMFYDASAALFTDLFYEYLLANTDESVVSLLATYVKHEYEARLLEMLTWSHAKYEASGDEKEYVRLIYEEQMDGAAEWAEAKRRIVLHFMRHYDYMLQPLFYAKTGFLEGSITTDCRVLLLVALGWFASTHEAPYNRDALAVLCGSYVVPLGFVDRCNGMTHSFASDRSKLMPLESAFVSAGMLLHLVYPDITTLVSQKDRSRITFSPGEFGCLPKVQYHLTESETEEVTTPLARVRSHFAAQLQARLQGVPDSATISQSIELPEGQLGENVRHYIQSLDPRALTKFVRFVTGRATLPPGRTFKVVMSEADRFVAHTCAEILELPARFAGMPRDEFKEAVDDKLAQWEALQSPA